MKKITAILLILLSLELLSCDKDFLTQDNPTATTDEKWWKTEQQALAALGACYAAVPTGTFVYQQNSRVSFSALTDESVWTANFFAEIPTIALGNASPISGTATFGFAIEPLWARNYATIRVCNRFLEHAPKTFSDPDNLKRYLAEARALRAWYHLDLFLYYGAIPIVTTAVPPEEADLKRNTVEEVIQFITSELEACAEGLPISYASASEDFRVTKGACLAMEADAFLNAGKFAEAATTAKKLIDLGYYQLYKNTGNTNESYKNLFENVGNINKERIFQGFTSGQSWAGNAETFLRNAPPGAGGTANVNPTAALVNTYETLQGKTLQELGPDSMAIYKKYPNYHNNRDPRLAGSIICPGETFFVLIDPFAPAPNLNAVGASNSSRTGYFVKKYVDLIDRTRNTQSPIPFMVYRYAGVLLTYIEALVESGQWDHPDVVKYLNEIRSRAGMPTVNTTDYNSQEKMRELYRRERRVELVFEGFRLFDIRRWKIGEQVMNGPVMGATNPADGQTVIVESRTFSSKHYLWPIPQRELEGNAQMTQNTGY